MSHIRHTYITHRTTYIRHRMWDVWWQMTNQWSVPAILLFAKNADNENEKCLKIKVFICISHSKLKKGYPFFNFHSPLRKPKKSAPFPHEKPDVFRICLRHKVNQLSSVIFISHESRKSWKETFLEFFQLFAFFFKVKKSRPFSSFFVWSFWADSCQIKAGISIFSPLNWQLSKWQVIVDSELWR